ncbi:MAG: MerR family transcriptional regulator [Vicinamibacterales bacterium]
MASTEIPNRAAFKAAEVCAIAGLQPYVLRTWEAEFPDLGVASSADTPRVYRKADVERVLRLKHLILVEGLTLAGARRKMSEADGTADEPGAESLLPALLSIEMRNRIQDLKRGLEGILEMLSTEPGRGGRATDFALDPEPKPKRKKTT